MSSNLQMMTRNLLPFRLAMIVAMGLLVACGGDDSPVAPAPDPDPPEATPTPPPSGRACTVGLELGAGQSCTFGGVKFEVRDDGFGCAFGGSICAGSGVSLNNFSAKKVSDNPVRWRIEALP